MDKPRSIEFVDGARVRIDGRKEIINMVAGGEFIFVNPHEIVEQGVWDIEIAASSVFNRTFRPAGQRVKWFRDELGQLWTKFSVAPEGKTTVHEHVVPASKVAQVRYRKYPHQ